MNLILSTTFLSLTPSQRETLIDDEDGISFYYPKWEERVMKFPDLRRDIKTTLAKVENIKKTI